MLKVEKKSRVVDQKQKRRLGVTDEVTVAKRDSIICMGNGWVLEAIKEVVLFSEIIDLDRLQFLRTQQRVNVSCWDYSFTCRGIHKIIGSIFT